ncbi:SPOR domain-containing protein [Novosphingobium sp. BL-8H]|uniref:SPOR domain-containing protein n=1 Tax=Novosphingobium sp. BL-8H TaxID=3127640 RepID=UPI0037569AB9
MALRQKQSGIKPRSDRGIRAALAFPMLAPITLVLPALVLPQASFAQSAPVVARPVVQALPGADSQRLSAALARLGRNPRDATALVDAADAAKALADYDAAIGFYRRADEITPGNAHIKAGLAGALAMSGDPVSAIPLFAEAEKAGATPAQIAADRGLAYDLVGANATAQHYYAAALGGAGDEEARMRLAISQAIAGDGKAAQTTLMPLLQKQDKPGWRTRAFALAIGGDTQQAVEVSNSILPPQLAQNIAPYLRYMPRLTRAQQAAAANLGKFPRASEIGHDDTRISTYATQLAASEAAMAQRANLASNQPATGRTTTRGGRKTSTAATPSRTAPAAGAQTLPLSGTSSSHLASTAGGSHSSTSAEPARVAPPEPMPTIERDASGELPAVGGKAPAAKPIASTPPVARATPPSTPSSAPAMSATGGQGLDLSRTQTPPAATAPARPVATQPAAAPLAAAPARPVTEAPPEPSAHQPSLAEIFADLGKPGMQIVPAAGAVDIRQIEPARPAPPPPPKVPVKPEVKPEPKPDDKDEGKPDAKPDAKPGKPDAKAGTKPDAKGAGKGEPKVDPKAAAKPGAKGDVSAKGDTPAKGKKPAVPTHPSRIWVQIGVGRNKDAIAFDWRRYLKQSPALLKGREPYVSDMGRTNRVLVGPFETQKAANAFIADAKKQGFDDALPWTSPAGQVVDPLSAK